MSQYLHRSECMLMLHLHKGPFCFPPIAPNTKLYWRRIRGEEQKQQPARSELKGDSREVCIKRPKVPTRGKSMRNWEIRKQFTGREWNISSIQKEGSYLDIRCRRRGTPGRCEGTEVCSMGCVPKPILASLPGVDQHKRQSMSRVTFCLVLEKIIFPETQVC